MMYGPDEYYDDCYSDDYEVWSDSDEWYEEDEGDEWYEEDDEYYCESDHDDTSYNDPIMPDLYYFGMEYRRADRPNRG